MRNLKIKNPRKFLSIKKRILSLCLTISKKTACNILYELHLSRSLNETVYTMRHEKYNTRIFPLDLRIGKYYGWYIV